MQHELPQAVQRLVSSGGPAAGVVQLDDIIFSLQAFGGVSTYWNQLGAALQARGAVTLLRSTGSRLTRLLPVASRAPVFHSSYFRVPLSRRTKCVVTVHDLAFERGIISTPTSALSRKARARAIRRADAIVCVSQHTRGELLECYPFLQAHPHVRVVHHGRGFIPDGATGMPERPVRRKKPFALFVGNRSGYKNFNLALEAFALSSFGREANLVCSGTALTKREMEDVQRLRLEGRVGVLPHAASAILGELYTEAAVLLYPSSYEGFGLPVVEAMTLSCPVIALGRSAIPEIAGRAGVLLSEAKAEAMADAIDRVVEPEYRGRLVQLGLENAKRFTWTASAAGHEDLYRELTM